MTLLLRNTQNTRSALLLIVSLSLPIIACEDDDPETTPVAGIMMTAGESIAGESVAGESMAGESMAGESVAGESMAGESVAGEEVTCEVPETDYPSESWPMCISDTGIYELAGANTPSSAARVAAYELIGDLLWRNANPSREDFIQAELIYAEDGGVGSRVTRRYDAHVPKPEDADCAADNAGEQWPEYCTGPGQIEPLILDAFMAGNQGEEPEVNAARVRAGLLWFFYLSVYKEAYTCAGKAADCDSHWAYHNGAKQRDEDPIGLGGEIKAASVAAYDKIFDAHLAVRCWRDLDNAEVAEDNELHTQVLDQLDRALDYGYVRMIASQVRALSASTDDLGLRVMLSILGPTLDRILINVNADLEIWASLWTSIGTLTDEVDAMQLSDAADELEGLVPCP